jgi:hypothetical protein
MWVGDNRDHEVRIGLGELLDRALEVFAAEKGGGRIDAREELQSPL